MWSEGWFVVSCLVRVGVFGLDSTRLLGFACPRICDW